MEFLKSDLGSTPVLIEAVMPASPARVFRAWTEPEMVLKWFGPGPNCLCAAEIDLKIGGMYRFEVAHKDARKSFFTGRYLDVESDKKLSFDWTYTTVSEDGEEDRSPTSRVTVLFKLHEKGTHLSLRHESIPSEGGRLGVAEGWSISIRQLLDLLHNVEKAAS